MKLDLSRETDAIFSSGAKLYRYSLWRCWKQTPKSTCLFIGLNPSTADKTTNDPTIRRCINFAKAWGYDSVEVVNLFAYRATKPTDLFKATKPIGSANNQHLLNACHRASIIIAMWGNHGAFQKRDKDVLRTLSNKFKLHCLGTNKQGSPKHPLYLPNETVPQTYQPE